MKKVFCLFCFCLVFSVAISGQDKPVLDTSPPPAAPKRTAIKTVGSADVLYHEAKKESIARNKSVNLFRTDAGWGTVSSSFVFSGKNIQKPTAITISVFIAAKDRTYVDDRKFVLYADDAKLFDSLSELGDGRTNGRDVYSSLRVSIPVKDFKLFALADKAIVRVGPTTFELLSKDLAGFRDLLTIIEEAP